MGILSTIVNKKACGGAQGANTGKLGCLSLFGQPTHLLAITKGFIIPKETDFNIAYISPLVQKGTIIPIIDASSFEEPSAGDTYTTNTSGEKRLDLQGLPEYKLMFEEGHEFYRELAKLRSYKSYDFIIGDDEGNWMVAVDSSGDYRGFTAGHVTPEMRKGKVKGGQSESKALLVQFLDRLQWDINYGIIHANQVDFVPQEVPAVNGAIITYAQVPSNLDVIIKVSVVLAADNNSPVEGLLATNFIVDVDGSDNPITLLTETSPGNYDLTITALETNEVVTVDLFDASLNSHITNSNDTLYRSESVSETVIV